jgi:choline/glycine/proline betaine transport protein
LALAYFAYRHRLPLLPRSVLHPLLGRHIYGTIGHIIDIVAILGTLFGVATSLGIGATQVNAGLTYLFGIPNNVGMQMLFIVIIISMATVSVALGLDKGIKVLSNLNVILAIILMIFLLLAGSTVALLKDYVQNLGYYINTLVSNTFNLYAYGKSHEAWMSSWTLFYWGWWIAWSPFVAMFIARVSKGRTIRSFIFGVLFVPTGFTFLWMTVFGNSAIDLVNQGMQQLVNADAPVALYVFLSNFPLAMITSLLGVFLVVTFFVTSSDSGSLVVDMLATGNAKHSITWHRVSWSLLEGIIAIALLYAGGLAALQTAVITTALPLLFILFFMSYSLFKALKLDYMKMESLYGTARHSQFAKADSQWPQHLDAIIHYPSKEEADEFMETRAKPAMNDVANKMRERNIDVTTHIDKDDAYLKVNSIAKNCKTNNTIIELKYS